MQEWRAALGDRWSGEVSWQQVLPACLDAQAHNSDATPLLDALLYEKIPRNMRARVLGALTTGVTAGMPIGSVLGALVVSQAGLLPALVSVAVVYGLVTLAPLVGRSWKGMGVSPA